MTYEPSEAVTFRQRLLISLGERGEVDYQESIRPRYYEERYTMKIYHEIAIRRQGDPPTIRMLNLWHSLSRRKELIE